MHATRSRHNRNYARDSRIRINYRVDTIASAAAADDDDDDVVDGHYNKDISGEARRARDQQPRW